MINLDIVFRTKGIWYKSSIDNGKLGKCDDVKSLEEIDLPDKYFSVKKFCSINNYNISEFQKKIDIVFNNEHIKLVNPKIYLKSIEIKPIKKSVEVKHIKKPIKESVEVKQKNIIYKSSEKVYNDEVENVDFNKKKIIEYRKDWWKTLNMLCQDCVKTCKQSSKAKIMSCPKYQKKR